MNRASVLLLCALLLGCGGTGDNEGRWLGYAEGENALIAPPEPGWITEMAVSRGQSVAQGDLLFTLEETSQEAANVNAQAAVAAAQASRAATQADVARSRKELARQKELVRIGGTPRRDLETAQAAFDAATARLAQADAQEAQAKAQLTNANFGLSERRVTARVAGRVEDIYARQGEFAKAGTPVLSVLPPGNIYVRFFVPEKDLSTVQLGQRVKLYCDGCPDDLFATISFLAAEAEFTPPIIYSVQNREKLVFKAEARAEGGLKLRPGLPVGVSPAPQD
jgi:HlyD family secretion protein